MARAGETYESGRQETIDPTSGGGPKSAQGGQHLGSYLGLAIVGMILVAMVFLQNASTTGF